MFSFDNATKMKEGTPVYLFYVHIEEHILLIEHVLSSSCKLHRKLHIVPIVLLICVIWLHK